MGAVATSDPLDLPAPSDDAAAALLDQLDELEDELAQLDRAVARWRRYLVTRVPVLLLILYVTRQSHFLWLVVAVALAAVLSFARTWRRRERKLEEWDELIARLEGPGG